MDGAKRIRLASLVLVIGGIASLPANACFNCPSNNTCVPGPCSNYTPSQIYGTCVIINQYAQICRFVVASVCTSNWTYCNNGQDSLISCGYLGL